MPTPTNILKFISGINDPELSQVQGHAPQKDGPHFRPTGYQFRDYPLACLIV